MEVTYKKTFFHGSRCSRESRFVGAVKHVRSKSALNSVKEDTQAVVEYLESNAHQSPEFSGEGYVFPQDPPVFVSVCSVYGGCSRPIGPEGSHRSLSVTINTDGEIPKGLVSILEERGLKEAESMRMRARRQRARRKGA